MCLGGGRGKKNVNSLVGWIPGCSFKKCIERRQSCKLCTPLSPVVRPHWIKFAFHGWNRLSTELHGSPNQYSELDVFSYIFSKTIGVPRFTPQLFPFAYQATAALLQTSLELLHGLAVCHALGMQVRWEETRK